MQTFLPYPSFARSAGCLDNKRLGKQRVEAKQILMILLGESKSDAWKNHPAVLMWKGHELALAQYGCCICRAWIARGFRDAQYNWFIEKMHQMRAKKPVNYNSPEWITSRRFTDGHRSNLVRKDPAHYRRFFPRIRNNIPYYWPVKSTSTK